MLNEQETTGGATGGGTAAQRAGATPRAMTGLPVQYNDNGRICAGQITGVNQDGSAEILVQRRNAAFTAPSSLYGTTPGCWTPLPTITE